MKKIDAAGGVVYKTVDNTIYVLLIYRNGYWDIPKGKLEKGELIRECAIREVSEEVGVALPNITEDLGTTHHSYEEKGKRIDKTTYWYAMKLANDIEEFIPQAEEGIQQVKWVELVEATKKVGFQNLVDVLNRFSALDLRA